MSGRTVAQILQSVSDVLFPEQLGNASITIDSVGSDGDTPLHVLAWRNDYEGVVALIRVGAPINAIGDMGQTPLHVAILQGNESIARALLSAGADTSVRSEFGETPFDLAMRKGGGLAALVSKCPV